MYVFCCLTYTENNYDQTITYHINFLKEYSIMYASKASHLQVASQIHYFLDGNMPCHRDLCMDRLKSVTFTVPEHPSYNSKYWLNLLKFKYVLVTYIHANSWQLSLYEHLCNIFHTFINLKTYHEQIFSNTGCLL